MTDTTVLADVRLNGRPTREVLPHEFVVCSVASQTFFIRSQLVNIGT